VENRVCLSHGVQVVGVVWRAATMVVAGVRDLVQRTGDDRTDRVLGGWAIESSSDDLCGLYHTQGARVSWFSLKIKDDTLSVVWTQNH
jgi:hypothetical protein